MTHRGSDHLLRETALAATLIFMVLVGGTDAGRYVTALRALNALVGAAFIVIWLRRAPRETDTVDRLVLAATLLFLLTCVTSQFTRDSFDAATTVIAFAAVLYVARGTMATARARELTITVLALSGLALSVIFLLLWGAVWAKWISISGAGLPPLDLVLPVGPYRHYHVVGTTVAVLMPALVVLARRPLVWPLGVIGIAAGTCVVFMSGSRTAWLALAAGMLLPAVTVIGPQLRRLPRSVWLIASAGVALLVIAGITQPVITRLTVTSTLEVRGAIWSATIGQWLAHPLVGSGPGSFFSTLTLSGYFDTYLEVGRHADNAVIQLLAEAGVVGIGALALVVAALVAGVRKVGAQWAPMAGLSVFAFASLTDNPSDSAHLVLIAIVWMALATPRGSQPVPRPTNPAIRISAYAAAVVIGIATTTTLAASWSYDSAAAANARGDTPEVLRSLERAATLDPSFALYQRELGVWLLADGNIKGAVSRIGEAARLNPADATAERALAIADIVDGRPDFALVAARRAVMLGRLHAENQLTLAYVATRSEDGGREAADALVAALQPWPWLAASPGWADYFPQGAGLQSLLVTADRSWSEILLGTRRYDGQRAWLAAMLGRTEEGSTGVQPTVLLIQCKVTTATAAVAELGPQRSTLAGLISRIMVARASGDSAVDDIALAQLRSAILGTLASGETPPASPLSGHVEDTRLYRRLTMAPPPFGPLFPTPDAGLSAWLRNPRDAARRGAPGSGLAECGG
jgi:O-antigen ligase